MAAELAASWGHAERRSCLIAGICGLTRQARAEATLARSLGYDAGLISLGALASKTPAEILSHCREVSKSLPLIGFYLQPSVGGIVLPLDFWRRFCEIGNVVAIKIAPFNRYRTLDVIRAVLESGRDDIALYTGNDDNIVADLLTPFTFGNRTRYIDGGLLGHWGIWTRRAVELLSAVKAERKKSRIGTQWLEKGAAVTDANAAIFDPAHSFAGCIPGIHEILRRQGLFRSIACLDLHEGLSPGQAADISRVAKTYPWMVDDEFVARNLTRWRS
jgi:dihydrodipicolinate synthase/N-acetylneuraminate lyase